MQIQNMIKITYFSFVLQFVFFQLTSPSIPKPYWDTLFSNYFFGGYDLVVALKKDSTDTFLSWLHDGKNSIFSILIVETNLSHTLESVRKKSRRVEQIAIIIEFTNITHLETHLSEVRSQYTRTTVAQPVYFVVTSSPAVYEDLQNNEKGLAKLSQEFSINSDFYIFGQNLNEVKRTKKPKKEIPDTLRSQGFVGSSFPDGFSITEIYSLKNMTFLEPVDLRQTGILQKVLRRGDFKNANIVAVAQYGYPERTNFSIDNASFTSGYEVDQLQFLASSYNFSIVSKLGDGWISSNSGQELAGMASQIINREADISISSSEMLADRAAQLTFLHPTYYTTIWGFFKQPASNSLRDIFINAFTLDLWLTMFATWILIITAMCALALVKWRLGTLHENDKIIIQEVLIWAAGAICQQGWHVCPEAGCMKIVFIFALITGLVSYVGYSAALVSILSVKVVPIQTLSDLISYRYTIYQDNETISTKYIIHDLEASGFIRHMPFEERSILSEDAMKKLLSSQSAFLGVTDLFYPVARSTLCTNLHVCKNIQRVSISKNRPVQGGMFVRKRSAFSDFFNHRILLMYERGIRFRLLENYFKESSVLCLDLNASDKEPLGLNDVVTAYIILLLGYLLSLTVFVVEKMCATILPDSDNATALVKSKDLFFAT